MQLRFSRFCSFCGDNRDNRLKPMRELRAADLLLRPFVRPHYCRHCNAIFHRPAYDTLSVIVLAIAVYFVATS